MLAGEMLTLEPEGYKELHRRGRTAPNTVEEFIEETSKHGPSAPEEPIWQRVS